MKTAKTIAAAAAAVSAAIAAAAAEQRHRTAAADAAEQAAAEAEAARDALEQYELDLAVLCAEAVADERARLRELDELAADLGPAFAADFARAKYEVPTTAGEVAVALLQSGRWRPGDVVRDELAERRGRKP